MDERGAVGPARRLPVLLEGATAAVLLVEMATGEVVYANDQARAMAGLAPLPLAVDAWSRLAGLTDASGGDLSLSDGPLSLISRGLPLSGQMVLREPTYASSGAGAERDRQVLDGGPVPEDVSGELWVTGVPMQQVDALSGFTLLVFLRTSSVGVTQDGASALSDVALSGLDAAMKGANAAADRFTTGRRPISSGDLAALRHRAVLAMDVAFTIADATAPDAPLIWVNPAFTRITGYSVEDVVDRNCRFLQGEGTDRAVVGELRDAMAAGISITRTLLNYRADGVPFWNEVAISPVRDADGLITSYVGIQADVTSRVLLERERAAAYAAEREARTAAERARAQTALIAEAGRAVTDLDGAAALTRLLELLVDGWVGWGVAYLAEDGVLRGVASRGASRPQDLEGHRFSARRPPAALRGALSQARATFIGSPGSPYSGQGSGAVAAAPLGSLESLTGLLVLGTFDPEAPDRPVPAAGESPAEARQAFLDLVDVVASRSALGLDIARLYRGQQELAEKLQRALLPVLPEVPGLELWGFYSPSDNGAKIGGDWYDAIPLGPGRTLITIGDVVGHDVEAATSMGRLRAVMQSYALEGLAPSELLLRMDAAIERLRVPHLATACAGVLDLDAGGHGTLTWSAAGHPPPMLRRADGVVDVLREGASPMLGAPGSARAEGVVPVGPGDTVLFYTDGLVEERGRLLSQGVLGLARQLTEAPGPGAERLGEALRPSRPELIEDDAAMLLAGIIVPGGREVTETEDAVDASALPHRAEPPAAAVLWHLEVPATYDAVRVLRREVVTNCLQVAGDLAGEGSSQALGVTLSELLTNAVRHAGSDDPLSLTVGRTSSGWLLEVFDSGSTPPRQRNVERFATSGRGLAIVAQLSSGVGWFPSGAGKCVWAEVPFAGR